MRRVRLVVMVLVLGWLAGQSAHPCGSGFVVRAYLNSRFWQPLAKTRPETWRPRTGDGAFAGMGWPTQPEMARAHAAYRALAAARQPSATGYWDRGAPAVPAQQVAEAREAVDRALRANPSARDLEELRLMECKIDLREVEFQDRARLPQVKTRLRAFLATTRDPRLASEGRGWLARVHYLLGEPHPAAKIYLRELGNPRSVFDRDSLLGSLALVFPYNGSAARLADHLEEYFDHPRNALFVVNLVTNPVYVDAQEAAARQAVGRRALAALERHEALFRQGPDSEALVLALMRAALYQGDPERAKAYGERLPADSARRAGPEFHWMAAVAEVLGGREAGAESHLRAVIDSPDTPWRYRAMARQGLIGIYQRLGRTPEALEQALLSEAGVDRSGSSDGARTPWYEAEVTGAWLLDLPYLLDFHAGDDDLRAALQRLGRKRALRLDHFGWMSAQELVTYALAVRHARREEYREAALLFAQAGAPVRAQRMREAARLRAAAERAEQSATSRLEARYRYAAFLGDHSTQLFFNDRLWYGFQRYALLGHPQPEHCREFPVSGFCHPTDRLDPADRPAFLEQERRVLDAQEERWRAYQLLDALAQEAGRTPLGRRAAVKALEALDGINTERFGRDGDVRAARKRLVAWLG